MLAYNLGQVSEEMCQRFGKDLPMREEVTDINARTTNILQRPTLHKCLSNIAGHITTILIVIGKELGDLSGGYKLLVSRKWSAR